MTDHKPFEEMTLDMQSALLDGCMKGYALGATVSGIVGRMMAWGIIDSALNETHRSVNDGAGVANVDELNRYAFENTLAAMFGSRTSTASTIRDICAHAAAYGRKLGNEQKDAFVRSNVESALQALIDDHQTDAEQVKPELAEAFFAELIKLDADTVIGFARRALVEHRIRFDADQVPSFRKFSIKYQSAILKA